MTPISLAAVSQDDVDESTAAGNSSGVRQPKAADAAGDLTELSARALTDRIGRLVERMQQTVDELAGLIAAAYERRAWAALGYSNWNAYVSAEFGTNRLRLDRDERQALVVQLRSTGMSTRAVGSALGVDQKTVVNDSGEENSSPATVVGLDGKSYTRPERDIDEIVDAEVVDDHSDGSGATAEQRRSGPRASRQPLTTFARDTGMALSKTVERLERIVADDRYPRNQQLIALQLRGHLDYSVRVCTELLARINRDAPPTPVEEQS